MTKVTGILQKVLVNYFYSVNAGFFLFGFFVLFGLPISPVAFHISLITGIIKSQVFVGIVLLAWLLYNFKCLNYMLKQLSNQRQSFLFCINGLPFKKVYLSMLFVQVLVYMPVLLYSVAIIWLAFKHQQYLCAFEVVICNIVIVAATSYVYAIALQKRQLFKTNIFLPALHLAIPKRLFLFPLHFLWNDRKQMLLVTKIFSLLLLYGFIKLYEPERYDIRPLQLCLLLTAASHSAIVYQIRVFEEEYLGFTKNLPLTKTGNFLRMMAMYLILLLPELIFLFKGIHIHFMLYDYPQLLLMPVALLCLFHVMLLLESTNMDQLIRLVFGVIAACFFILLYNPGLILPAVIMLFALALYSAYCFSSEAKSG